MVDPISISSVSRPCVPSGTTTRRGSEATPRLGLGEDRAGDLAQLAGGVADRIRDRANPGLADEIAKNRTELSFRERQLAAVEARYQSIVRDGGDELAKVSAAGNLRLETKGLLSAQQRSLDLAETKAIDSRASDIGEAVGVMFAVKTLVDGERKVRETAKTNARAAWRVAVGTAMSVLADGASMVLKPFGGGLKGAAAEIGMGEALKRIADRSADATFDPINRFVHFVTEKSWWPKQRGPRTPLDG